MIEIVCPNRRCGHRARSTLLAEEFGSRGLDVFMTDTFIPGPDILIVDVPNPAPLIADLQAPFLVVMGDVVPGANLNWHPLGPPGPRTLGGVEYLILDPRLGDVVPEWSEETVVYVGSHYYAPEFRPPENWGLRGPVHLVSELPQKRFWSIIAGASGAILAWGQSFFEGLWLRGEAATFSAIPAHLEEIRRLGGVGSGPLYQIARPRGLDLLGAQRTVDKVLEGVR